ncbi:DUF11 domain-containing protein [Saccharothrix luteola]|uniref:DUF11 domain-containing protein n=1 Tax=Saccharothrix luteola TaxID=2893018 RepID=UPI001E64098D|nr:DUF11 domain-containing protein [Saccharothrix luteola]MCC8246120.1 DUF11 domain-containing protein [Saccharothrix luteola]
MVRTLLVAAVTAALLVPGAQVDAAPAGADLSVDLTAVAAVVMPVVDYHVSVTNNGPEPLTSATVVVALDPRSWITTTPCAFADATLTCSFGSLAPGATTTLVNRVYFAVFNTEATVDATATRTASTPADPNAGNDADTARCRHEMEQIGFPPWPYYMRC